MTLQFLYVWSTNDNAEDYDWRESRAHEALDDETDEELEEEYANIEVNFDESETEEEDYVSRSSVTRESSIFTKETLIQDQEYCCENELEECEEGESFPDEFLLFENREIIELPVTVSNGKSFIEDDLILKSGNFS